MIDGLVSIIMPAWNCAQFIAESIQSVCNQTYPHWELLIVDDCSTDDTFEVIRPFLEDTRIRYFKNEKNSRAAYSRNRGVREAQGEWIAFLDSDDLWVPEKLEKQLAFMHENGYTFSYHSFVKMDEAGQPLHVRVSGPACVDKRLIYRYDYIGQLTMMYSAKAFGLVQVNVISRNEDYGFRLQLFRQPGAECHFLNEDLAIYRLRKQSLSHVQFSKQLKSHYDVFRTCDGQSVPASLWYTAWNMFFGLMKKLRYEKKF
ncbi:MAG: glycosyltransferase family 2 protein [Clostridia bacterium]|nr:glycosyltransferase family 2 protein [Clostridia bacterium]